MSWLKKLFKKDLFTYCTRAGDWILIDNEWHNFVRRDSCMYFDGVKIR